MLDIFTHVFVINTLEYEIVVSLLTRISNTLRALLTPYEFTREFFAFIILLGVNILQVWLSLS